MGIIQRQGFKTSIIGYFGVLIGGLSTLFIYPKALEMYGLYRFLYDTGVLIGIFVLMGSSASAIRFYPRYQDKATGHNGLLTWLLMVIAGAFIVLLLIFPFMDKWLDAFVFTEGKKEFADFAIYLLPFTLLLALINMLKNYVANFRRIVIPSAFDQLTIKLILPLILLMYLAGWIHAEGVVIGTLLSFAFTAAGILWYLAYLGELRLTRPAILKDRKAMKEYASYSLFVLLAGIGSHVAFRIDGLMVAGMIEFQAAGIYAISLTLSEVILKPMSTLANIAGPILSQHIAKNEWAEVETLYKKSSLNMTIIGLGLFLLIWTVLPYLFEIMPNTEAIARGTYVVFFLGLAQVADMATGVNNEIISYSKHYRVTLVFTLALGALTILFNLLFIPLYGIPGAALATFLSITIYNVVKLFFIKVKFGFQPFTPRVLPAIGFAVAAWLVSRFIPAAGSPVLNTIIKGGIFLALYGFAILYYQISPDINTWVRMGYRKGLERLRRPRG